MGPKSPNLVFFYHELRNKFETETRMFVGGSNHKLKLMLTVRPLVFLFILSAMCSRGMTYSDSKIDASSKVQKI